MVTYRYSGARNVIHWMAFPPRAAQFIRFLRLIDATVPADLAVHVALDNVSTHKPPAVQRWLVKHSRFTLHVTPTCSSQRNLVERWFSELTTTLVRRGTHRSVSELMASTHLDHQLERRPRAVPGTRAQMRSSATWLHTGW